MALGADRSGTRADTAALVACVVLSLTALALPDGLRTPISGALRETVLRPALSLERSTVRSAENRQRLDALRAERDSLALRAADLPQLRNENGRLRGLLGLGGRIGTGFLNAEVLHQAGVADQLTLVLSAGLAEGVTPLAPVVAPAGLVGIVHRVDRHTSVALAWTHPDFRASAMVDAARIFGIVAARRGAQTGEMMELAGVAYQQQLAPGTRVVTSGLGGVFPRGIPIGTVEGVLSEAAGWERTYLLRPAVHPAEASHVLVLLPGRVRAAISDAFADTARADSTPTVAPSGRPMSVPLQYRPRRRPAADTTPPAEPVPRPLTDTLRRP